MISRETLNPWLRRPLVLAVFAVVALAALLSGGLVVARAVDGAPAADSTASPSPAGSNGDNNVAAGVNTKDGKTVYAIKLKIVQTTSDTVDATNAAVAVNSGCTDCATFAIAFEGVIVVGSPSTFTPTNLALAYNQDCSGCTAFADAYQQVVQTSTRVRVSKQGRKQIAAIRKDLGDLKHSTLTFDEIRARVAADEQAFADVLRNDLVPVGHVTEPAPSDAPDVSDNPDAAPTSTQPTATADSTASPAGSPSSTDPTSSPAASDPAASPSEQPPSPSSSP
ncbi:MAG: putative peptide zinc metalloprotease protein [Actinomycetota bacterium]|nr:putative peptide zinc metalloprotease protein [Actinomycetota bacterium]